MFRVLGVGKGNRGIVTRVRIIEYACMCGVTRRVSVYLSQYCRTIPVIHVVTVSRGPLSVFVSCLCLLSYDTVLIIKQNVYSA